MTYPILKTIETTYEFIHESFIYRLIENDSGVLAKRTGVARPLWGHGITVQMPETIDFDNFKWKPSCVVSSIYMFTSLAEAIERIMVKT